MSQIRELLSRPSVPRGLDDLPWSDWRRDLVKGLLAFDTDRADRVYNQALSGYPVQLACEKLLERVIDELQQRWADRFVDAVERAFTCSGLRCRLSARIYQNNSLQPGSSRSTGMFPRSSWD